VNIYSAYLYTFVRRIGQEFRGPLPLGEADAQSASGEGLKIWRIL